MPSTLSSACGEELTANSRQQRRLLASSGDPTKDALVAKIKSFQVSGMQEKLAWGAFCEKHGGNVRDPVRHPVEFLHQFVQEHCLSEASEGCSSHPWNVKKQPPCPTPAEALTPSDILSQKVELLFACVSRRKDA